MELLNTEEIPTKKPTGIVMKKAFIFLPGVIAVMLAAAPMITGFNNAAVAQPAHAGGWHDEWKKLNLSPDQETQIKKIRQDAKQQTDAIITPEQKTQLEQARSQHTKPKITWTDDQKAQLKQIHQDTESKILAVLNDTQKQQYQQILAQHKNHHAQ